MPQHQVRVTSIKKVTHDVLQIVTEKPRHFAFTSGQATEVSINKAGWKRKKRPFTFTNIPDSDSLEFTIKIYPSHEGVTNELRHLNVGDQLIVRDTFGAIAYKGEGVFIAGGAGVTPFVSILRYLQSKKEIGGNKLIFANKTKGDIILEKEFKKLLGKNFINILSDERVEGYAHGQITQNFLKVHSGGINKYFYICGPPPMLEAIEKQLAHLNVDKKHVVKEKF
jgi:ferredoxin-NADP reductase